ncbi:MAG: hypothetical protein R2726_18595 [Acidimicrobiales bacterium]
MTSSADHGPAVEPGSATEVTPSSGALTRLAVGALTGLADQVGSLVDAAGAGLAGHGPSTPGPEQPTTGRRVRDVVVGVVFETQDRVGGTAERVGAVVSPWGRWVWRSPAVGPVRRAVDARLDALAERGAHEQAAGRALTSGVVDGAVARVAGSDRLPEAVDEVVGAVLPGILDAALPVAIDKLGERPELIEGLVGKILDGILEAALPEAIDKLGERPELIEGLVGKILDGILDAALPEAIDKLSGDPDLLMPVVVSILPDVLDAALPVAIEAMGDQQDAIREIVRSSSDRISTDMANTVRSRTVRGDDLVERIARRLTLRRERPALPPRHQPPPSALDARGPVAELGAGGDDPGARATPSDDAEDAS